MATGKPDVLLLLLTKLLEDGNILYKKNRIKDASTRYQVTLCAQVYVCIAVQNAVPVHFLNKI